MTDSGSDRELYSLNIFSKHHFLNSPKGLVLFLIVYFSLHVALRVLLSDSLEKDEAEQMVLSQWLFPGYTSQPPLYTWLQILFFKVFGTSVFSLSLLKNLLILLSYIFVYLGAKQVCAEKIYAEISTLSLFFIIQISWSGQRDLTHSILLLCTCAATFYVILRLLNRPSWPWYLLLGVVSGMGMLSKSGFFLFLLAMILSLLSTSKGRQILFSRGILFSVLIMGAVVLPCGAWAISHQEIVTDSMHKLKIHSCGLLKPYLALLLSVTCVLGPLFVIYAVLFSRAFMRSNRIPHKTEFRLTLTRYFAALFVIFMIGIAVLQPCTIKNRWLAPLLFLAPVAFFQSVKPRVLGKGAIKGFWALVLGVAILIPCIMTLRVIGAARFDPYTDFNYPSRQIASELKAMGFEKGLIIADRQLLAGNMKVQFPDSLVLIPKLRWLDLSSVLNNKEKLLLIWDARKSKGPPSHMIDFLSNISKTKIGRNRPAYLRVPYRYARGHYAEVGCLIFSKS